MNNSTRNFKMKKLLIASTALIAVAGMANADITISGHAAAGFHSGLADAANVAAVAAATAAAAASTAAATASTAAAAVSQAAATEAGATDVGTEHQAVADAHTAAAAASTAAAAASTAEAAAANPNAEGIYSNAGVDFTMTGATDNGISFSATVNVDAGTEIDTGDFEFDGNDGGTAGLGAVSMTGTFGTLTFDNNGIDNLYDDATTHDVSYSTTLGAVALTVAYDATADSANATSMTAAYTAGGMAFTLTGSEAAAGTSAELAVSYALNDTVTITADTDQAAGAESVQTIGATTTLNGVSVAVSSANNSTWDVDLGYTAGGFALTYGVDEADAWDATATAALGGGASFSAGVNSADSMYAGVSFAF